MISGAVDAIKAVDSGSLSYCKFLSANDAGEAKGHQNGILIVKEAWAILFDKPGVAGRNKERRVKIHWMGDIDTDSRFVWYGASKLEYRITRFGRNFPYRRPENAGDLFVLIKNDEDDYSAYVLGTEEDMEAFLAAFAMSPADTNRLIDKQGRSLNSCVESAFDKFIRTLVVDFPASADMAAISRRIFRDVVNRRENVDLPPDDELLSWLKMEYRLFRRIEVLRYGALISKGFSSVEQFIEVANTVLNRRKSRAGKSLEHHLKEMFDVHNLACEPQARTEGGNKPDFLFPGGDKYHDPNWSRDRLVFLGVKTTCKDRWRQILREADRIRNKHLFTLQQGMSVQQLKEMAKAHVTLVVPSKNVRTYPKEKQASLLTLEQFIKYTARKTTL